MKSKILSEALESLIHIESEELNYFMPFSSDIESIDCDIDRNDITWCSVDPSDTDKPLTLVIDVIAVNRKRTSRVQGFYLIKENLSSLRTFEGDHAFGNKAEYFMLSMPLGTIIKHHEESGEFCYVEGFRSVLLGKLLELAGGADAD